MSDYIYRLYSAVVFLAAVFYIGKHEHETLPLGYDLLVLLMIFYLINWIFEKFFQDTYLTFVAGWNCPTFDELEAIDKLLISTFNPLALIFGVQLIIALTNDFPDNCGPLSLYC